MVNILPTKFPGIIKVNLSTDGIIERCYLP